jgi:hypothetical protein
VQLFDDFIVRSPVAGTGITVALKGTELLLPRIARIRIQNTGKLAIRPEDHYGLMTIEAPSARIHSVDYVGAVPADVLAGQPVVQLVSDSAAVLASLLLNAGDSYDVQCVIDGGRPGSLAVTGRIAGQSRAIKRVEQGVSPLQLRIITSQVFMANLAIGATLLFGLYLGGSKSRNHTYDPVKVIAILLVPMIILITVMTRAVIKYLYKLRLPSGWSPFR